MGVTMGDIKFILVQKYYLVDNFGRKSIAQFCDDQTSRRKIYVRTELKLLVQIELS